MEKLQVQLNNCYSSLNFKEEAVMDLLQCLYEFPLIRLLGGELSVAFLSDDKIAQVHQDFLSDETPTDVITFEGDQDMNFAGEICVSIDHAIKASKAHGTTFSEELTLYLVHGCLHLTGFDDLKEDDRKKMRVAEKECMNHLSELRNTSCFELSK